MASTRIATPPRVKCSKKSASTPEDPMITQARAVAETINQLRFGRTLKNPVPLPFANKEGTDFLRPLPPAPPRPKTATHRRSSDASLPALERHRRKCIVCKHPDREEIEEEFIHWRRPGDITYDFGLEDSRYLRRHAHAVGLYALRRENYLFTLENFLERGDEIDLTAASYIKAVRAYACMCDTVRWTEPAIRVVNFASPSAPAPDCAEEESMAASPSSLPPARLGEQTAFDKSEPASSARSAAQPATEFPPRKGTASAVPSDETASGSPALPEAAFDKPVTAPSAARKTPVAREKQSVAASSTLPPEAATPISAPSALLPNAQKTECADTRPDSSLATSHSSLPSNRPSPRLERAVTGRKQRKEVRSNRPQIAK